MGIEFGMINEEDLEQCVDLVFASLRDKLPREQRNREIVKQMIYGTQALSLVAKKNGKIVGLISGVMMLTPNINFISVIDEESAQQGLGGVLIDKFIEAVKKSLPKASHVRITLSTDDTPIISLCSLKFFMIKGFFRESSMNKDMIILEKNI